MFDKLHHYLLSALFLAAIGLPALVWLNSSTQEISKQENRRLKTFPSIKFDDNGLQNFPKEFESYFKDHYGFRHELVSTSKSLKQHLFNKSPIKHIIRGNDDWLFANQDGSLRDHIGLSPITDDILAQWQQHLSNKSQWLDSLGAQYLLVPVPNKMTLFTEHLPQRIRNHSSQTMLDLLLAELDKQNDFKGYINLEPLLRAQKETGLTTLQELAQLQETENLYFKQDTHWTSFGAFLSYQHIMNKLKTMLPELSPALTFDDIYAKQVAKRGDLARMSQITVKEMHHHIKQKEQCAIEPPTPVNRFKDTEAYKLKQKRLPTLTGCPHKNLRAVVVNDSFGAYLKPFFAESFNQVIFMNSYDLVGMESFLREFKPDVFIDIRVERSIKRLLAPNEKLQKRLASISSTQ
ncbi:MAG: alginate O-acetyltransferase AlgX-related protein [Arenicella sp.]